MATLLGPWNPLRRAAAYVRMSTDQQTLSVETQLEAIENYASFNQFEIVKVYADLGKSGLSLRGRTGLQELLSDISSRAALFSVVLVLDVTRWGRFQDPDEAAYYEYACRNSGVEVIYVAEEFEMENTLVSAVLKSVKRSMAGEYSRDLSRKVFAGQCRVARQGHVAAGRPGLGLRRAILNPDGTVERILSPGERKPRLTDRVTYVPGPKEEVALLRRIYAMFADEGVSMGAIVRMLNNADFKARYGKELTLSVVRKLLRSEKYIGTNIYNKSTARMASKVTPNRPEDWIRIENAFEPVIDRDLFERAQLRLRPETSSSMEERLLTDLRKIWEKNGTISRKFINAEPGVFSAKTYVSFFGNLNKACEKIGVVNNDTRLINRQHFLDLCENVQHVVETLGGQASFNAKTRTIAVNGSHCLHVAIDHKGKYTNFGRSKNADRQSGHFYVILSFEGEASSPHDVYIVPCEDAPYPLRLSKKVFKALAPWRYSDLRGLKTLLTTIT